MASNQSLADPSQRWWGQGTVAVVTGGNKGIGLELVRELAKHGLTVVLTSRDASKGQAALSSIMLPMNSRSAADYTGNHQEQHELHNNIVNHQLDVTDPISIQQFTSWLKQSFGGLDILVNNAGVSFNDLGENSVKHADIVVSTNYRGPKMLTESLLPLFRRSPSSISRILNMSSRLGLLNKLANPALKKLLQDEESLTEDKIEQMLSMFLTQVKDGTWKEGGWPNIWTDYSVSKLALNAYSSLLAHRLAGRVTVNCYCPGFTMTSMTRGKGVHTAKQAAEVGVKILLLPVDELPTGKFFSWSSMPHHYSKL